MRLVSAGRLAPVLWAAILLAACGGDGSSGGGGAGGATGGGGGSGGGSGGGTGGGQTFTYSTLADLQGDQTFTTASVSYQDDVQVAGFQAFNLMLQAYSEGPQVEYVAASDIFRLTAPGAAYAVEVSQATPTNSGPNFRQWRVDAGATTDVVTLFEAFGSYAFVGTWGHIEGGVLTNYLMSTGIATQTGDFPTGSVTYNVRMGGSANINVGTGPSAGVDTSRSTGTLTVNFETGIGNFSVELFASDGTSLGIMSGTLTRDGSGPGFTGTSSLNGADGLLSGAFFGPQAAEISLNYALSGERTTLFGQGGGAR